MPKANGRKFSNFTPRDIPSQVNQILLYFLISNNKFIYVYLTGALILKENAFAPK